MNVNDESAHTHTKSYTNHADTYPDNTVHIIHISYISQ